MDIENELAEIRTGISNAQRKVARAKVEHENATERANEAKNTLIKEFELSSLSEAKETRERLEEELRTVLEKVKSDLDLAQA
jgi:hypothetical protein